MKEPKIIVILGPTASGKTGLGVRLASKYDGEIVSADSRQVFKGMDIGTGKDLQAYEVIKGKKKIKIPHHLIDVVSPKVKFDLAQYQKLAFKAIDDILRRGKLPIVVGGSGLYLQAVVDNYSLPKIKPDSGLRKELGKLNIEELFLLIKKANAKLAGKINNSDKNNKRRLIRYAEILKGKVDFSAKKNSKKYEALLIGLACSKEILEERIKKRIIIRLENEDMIGEVERLKREGLSSVKLESFGLEYKFISWYLRGKMDYDTMVEKLFIASRQFAKRQLVWFRRWEKQGTEINWVNNKKEAEKLVRNFIK